MKQFACKISDASQSCVGFSSKIGLVKDKTSRLVRKVFPTRPALGLFIAGVLAIEVVAVAHAGIVANSRPVMGTWGPISRDLGTGSCRKDRSPDTCIANGPDDIGKCKLTPNARSGRAYASEDASTGGCGPFGLVPPQGGYAVDLAEKVIP
jgi:hypothetical protein